MNDDFPGGWNYQRFVFNLLAPHIHSLIPSLIHSFHSLPLPSLLDFCYNACMLPAF